MIKYYKDLSQKYFSDNPWLLQLQKKALQNLDILNFPNRHDEDWKYSPVDYFLKEEFAVNKSDKNVDIKAFEALALGKQIDVPHEIKIPFINGEVVGLDEIRAKLPEGIIVDTISNALIKYPELVKKYLDQVLTTNNGMHALNSAMLRQGLFIYVSKDIKCLDTILLTNFNTEDNQAIFLRHLMVAEEGSVLKIIEDYQGTENCKYFTNVITEIVVGARSKFSHFKVQREGFKSLHFGHVFVKQFDASLFTSHLLNIGGHWSRADISVDLIEHNAKCILSGVYMPINDQIIENKTFVNHAVSNCYSEQDYRGIAADKAQAVFNGKIYVAKDSIATEAKQQNKNLLLSNFAKIYTKPQLEIFADDVVCTHGATVGQLDEEALFYFATRGIEETEARRYLLHAFVDENISKVDNKHLANWMSSLLEQQMR